MPGASPSLPGGLLGEIGAGRQSRPTIRASTSHSVGGQTGQPLGEGIPSPLSTRRHAAKTATIFCWWSIPATASFSLSVNGAMKRSGCVVAGVIHHHHVHRIIRRQVGHGIPGAAGDHHRGRCSALNLAKGPVVAETNDKFRHDGPIGFLTFRNGLIGRHIQSFQLRQLARAA